MLGLLLGIVLYLRPTLSSPEYNITEPSVTIDRPTSTLPPRPEPTVTPTVSIEKPVCPAGKLLDINHCSCIWECVDQIPDVDCTRICPQDYNN